jgi:hypothetical protein
VSVAEYCDERLIERGLAPLPRGEPFWRVASVEGVVATSSVGMINLLVRL